MLHRTTYLHTPPAIFAGLLLVALAGSVLAQSPPGDAEAKPADGVLVLYGGQVLVGKISRADDLYLIAVANGEIRVRAGEVAYHCASLDEAYRRRRADIRLDSADEHIDLAAWCLRNGLVGAAAAELADVMARDPANPIIQHLERRLDAARRPFAPTSPAPPAARTVIASAKELEQMVRRMPHGSVEAFRTSVQPVLLSSCTTGGCHGPQSADRLRLLRGSSGAPPSGRATQRNLHAVLALVDRQRPEASPLLVEAVRAHGTAAEPALTDKDAARYHQIVQWIQSVARADQPDRRTPQTVGPRSPATPGAVVAATVRGSNAAADVKNPWPEPPATDDSHQQPAPANVKLRQQTEPFVPVDPFDPEIFNRQSHGGS